MSDRGGSFHISRSFIGRWLPGAAAPSCRPAAGLHGSARRSSGPRSANHAWRELKTRGVLRIMVVLGFFSLVAGALAARNTAATGLAASVDPLVGTGSGPGGTINLFPGPTLPFGMVQLSPDTESRGYGYHYDQGTIQGFSMTHMSGVGCPNEGDVFFTATTGPVLTGVSDFQSPYSHSQEAATPGYYRVALSRWDVNVELTATDRAGLAQFSFPAGKAANILLPISHTLNNTVGAYIQVVGDRQIDGYVVNHIFCDHPQTYKVYFAMTFDRPFSTFGAWNGNRYGGPGKISAGERTAAQTGHNQWIGAYATWPSVNHPQTITAKIAISYVDQAGAENNLKAETAGKNFSRVRRQANEKWNKALSAIEVSGGAPANRTVFYTGLYHSLLMPTIESDADGRYLGFDGKIHQVASRHLVYTNFSGWDIYRTQMPLLAMIEPQRMEDMSQSIALMYKQGGWIDRWPQLNDYTNEMAGSPQTIEVAMAWLDGLHGFDIDTAWQGMLEDATHAPPPGHFYQGEIGIDWINKLHYVPYDKIKYGSVSQLQEDAIAYASLYRLAVDLGKTDDAKALYQRALYYRNVFDPQDRFFRPRNADGQWAADFDPAQDWHGFIEGSGWQYQWLAPSDMAWLIRAVGPDLFNQRLSDFFNYPKPEVNSRYYTPYNETDLQAPFEFNFSGKPWEGQRAVRRALTENYRDTPDGIPGNDDCGEMSSWAVMSMMGIYTVDPASLAYEVVSPMFPKIVLHLKAPYAGKRFTIETSADPETTPYIQDLQLNGHSHPRNWITFKDISNGGALHFTLGSNPNHAWGAAPKDAPPSLSDGRQ